MKASSETLRKQNRALVLASLRQIGPVSHTDIAEWTGLSSATVSAITGVLETDKVILRLEQTSPGGRGRPRVLFRQNPDSAYIAAVRITGDKVEYSLVDYCGVLKDRFKFDRDPEETSTSAFATSFKDGLSRLAERADLEPDRIVTISITSKGLVARGRPVLLWSPVFDDEQINFESLLKPEWTGRIYLTNETRFAAQAVAENARQATVQPQPRKFATLSLDHSIGLGIAEEDTAGRVSSFAPPFGHMVHQPDGPVCRCGSRGCIEAYAGFYGILRTAFEVKEDSIPAKFIPFDEMNKIAERARAGDRMAQYAFRRAGEVIGIGISRLHSFLGTMPVTITGPGLEFFDLMSEGFEKNIESNLQVRLYSMPTLALNSDEPGLIFQGNVQASLADLDANIMSERNANNRKSGNE